MKNFTKSAEIMSYLAQHECPAITSRRHKRAQMGGIQVPIVWKKAYGLQVFDVDDNEYLDFTAGFGVMALGYNHPKIVSSIHKQIEKLNHAMGDAYCSEEKSQLFKTVFKVLPKYLTRILLGNSGSDAIEAALKTAILKNKNANKHQFISFSGSYHGLSIGSLNLSFFKDEFREPFTDLLSKNVFKAKYPNCANCPFGKNPKDCHTECLDEIKDLIQKNSIAGIFIELIQGRGGILQAPIKYIQELAKYAKETQTLLIVDEIFTGFGRCGHFLLSEYYQIEPDIITLGKGFSGGVPISMMVAKEEVMCAWEDSKGEAIHTSTFLGNPLNCAYAINTIETLLEISILENVQKMSEYFFQELHRVKKSYPHIIGEIRGMGLMIGVEILPKNLAFKLCQQFLLKGIILLPCGLESNILSITPPLIIEKKHIDQWMTTFDNILMHYSLKQEIQNFINDEKNSDFNSLALKCFNYQCSTIPLYKKWVENQIQLENITSWEQIPALPVEVFKDIEISTYPKEEIAYRFFTSGTSAEKKGVHPYKDLDIYKLIIELQSIKDFVFEKDQTYSLRILTPHHEEKKDRSLNFMFTHLYEKFGNEGSRFYYKNGQFLSSELLNDLTQDCKDHRKVILLGTSLSFLEFIDQLKKTHSTLPLPKGSIILDTGGTKGKFKELPQNLYTDFFQIDLDHQYNEYGMTELTSYFYAKKSQPNFTLPHWVKFQIIHGNLCFFDLGNYDFISKIMTSDTALIHAENTFELLGRSPMASLRGCSLDYEGPKVSHV